MLRWGLPLSVVLLAGAASAFAARATFLSQASSVRVAPLPAPARPAFAIPTPRPLEDSRYTARWMTVVHDSVVRRAPTESAVPIAALSAQTPEGTSNVVLSEGRTDAAAGRLWVEVRVPALPTNLDGWVRRDALGSSGFVHTRLVVDRARLTATLLSDGRAIFRARIGAGKPESPTPGGEFYVRSKIRSLSSFYGPLAFGTSARSPVLTDWPGGGFIGIHGTDQPGLLPGWVSHGCIRMRNEDILRLGRLMPVGTPVTIR